MFDWFTDPLGFRALSSKLDALISSTRKLTQMEYEIMANLDRLNGEIASLTAKVEAQTTLDASVATLVIGLVQQSKDLAAQIAELSADDVTQEEIDAIADQVKGQAEALESGTAALQAAVPANTET